jgi:hypothetical protein
VFSVQRPCLPAAGGAGERADYRLGGALLALTVFNFFIYSITRDRSSLYYSLYVLCYAVAWGMTFHLSAAIYSAGTICTGTTCPSSCCR